MNYSENKINNTTLNTPTQGLEMADISRSIYVSVQRMIRSMHILTLNKIAARNRAHRKRMDMQKNWVFKIK